jgi:hypothetical protein
MRFIEKEPDNTHMRSVRVAKAPWTLDVVWADGKRDRVDLTGLIYRSRHFRAFLEDPQAFDKVSVTRYRDAIEWDNGLDYDGDTLKMMANEQQPVTGADLVAFEKEGDLSTAETASLLGLAARTVRDYRKVDELPPAVAMAIRAYKSSATVLAAHFRPAGQLTAGRPTSVKQAIAGKLATGKKLAVGRTLKKAAASRSLAEPTKKHRQHA